MILNRESKLRTMVAFISDPPAVRAVLAAQNIAFDTRPVMVSIWTRRDVAEEFAAENRALHGHDAQVYPHPQGALQVIRLNPPPPPAPVDIKSLRP